MQKGGCHVSGVTLRVQDNGWMNHAQLNSLSSWPNLAYHATRGATTNLVAAGLISATIRGTKTFQFPTIRHVLGVRLSKSSHSQCLGIRLACSVFALSSSDPVPSGTSTASDPLHGPDSTMLSVYLFSQRMSASIKPLTQYSPA